MKQIITALLFTMTSISATIASTPEQDAYVDSVQQWRDKVEQSLRRDNGWLTLAGRFQMKPGANTFGTGKDNDIVFPPELKGTGPERLGTLVVDSAGKKVSLKLANGVSMTSDGKAFTGERVMGTGTAKRDWVALGRINMHIIEREGRYILRLADNESLVRKNFPGRIWYAVDEKFKVAAKFVAYPPGKDLDCERHRRSVGRAVSRLRRIQAQWRHTEDGCGRRRRRHVFRDARRHRRRHHLPAITLFVCRAATQAE